MPATKDRVGEANSYQGVDESKSIPPGSPVPSMSPNPGIGAEMGRVVPVEITGLSSRQALHPLSLVMKSLSGLGIWHFGHCFINSWLPDLAPSSRWALKWVFGPTGLSPELQPAYTDLLSFAGPSRLSISAAIHMASPAADSTLGFFGDGVKLENLSEICIRFSYKITAQNPPVAHPAPALWPCSRPSRRPMAFPSSWPGPPAA